MRLPLIEIVLWEVLSITSLKPIKVVELTKDRLDEASRVYAQGLLSEDPPGSTESLEDLTESLRLHLRIYLQRKKNRHIWLAEVDAEIKGILDYIHEGAEIFIRFICAVPSGHGIGTQLIRYLAKYASQREVTIIRSTVSSIDSRACKFYFDHLGFEKTGKRPEGSGFDLFLAAINPQEILRKHTSPH